MMLTKPTWETKDGRIKLFLGDCLEILPTFQDNSVNAVISDPPYGIEFDRATWNDDKEEYVKLMRKVVYESNRVATGVKAFWQALINAPRWHLWFPDKYRIFASCKGFVQFRPTSVQWSWDPVIWWGDPNKEPSVYNKDWFVQATAPFGAGRKSINHPSPRPIETMVYVVDIFSKPNDIVLDPFMGSGTTGIACYRTGRRFIGIEINEKYFNLVKERIEEEMSQPILKEASNENNTNLRLL